MKRSGRIGAALLCLGAGLYLLAGARPRPVGAEELMESTGLVRGLVVPFLWAGLGEAMERGDSRASLAQGRWLMQVVPEYEFLPHALALRYVYELGDRNTAPETQAERLAEALLLLRQSAERHPERHQPIAVAAYLIWERCLLDSPETAARRAAFQRLTGIDARKRAGQLLLEAAERSDEPLSLDSAGASLAWQALQAGERRLAATLYERAARQHELHPTPELDRRAVERERVQAYRHGASWLRQHPERELPQALLDALQPPRPPQDH